MLHNPVSEQIITSAELRKAPSVMSFPAKEMSNSMQEGSREKEIELLRARSELITEAGNGPQGMLTAGLGWSGEERDKSRVTPAQKLLQELLQSCWGG